MGVISGVIMVSVVHAWFEMNREKGKPKLANAASYKRSYERKKVEEGKIAAEN